MPPSSALPTSRYPRAKILVIDDDPSMLTLVKRQLENAGYAVLLAEDGIVGGRLALNAAPNLILLDVDMPYLSGYELAQFLKADPITWDIPVVFLTSDKAVEERTIRLGAQAYIKKPLNVNRLLDTVALFTIDAAPSDLQASCPPQNKF
jgi:CheY-like chemotaxis protein